MIDLLKEVLEIPTYSGNEGLVRDFIISFGIKHGITVIQDTTGNVYLKKGKLDEGESYIMVMAHMDTVHFDQDELVDEKRMLSIIESSTVSGGLVLQAINPKTNTITGIGGDDKAGVAICLDIILKTDKIIGGFFVEEEIGCNGSQEMDVKVLENVGYAIAFDAPTDNWCSYISNGVPLFDKEFYSDLKPLLEEFNVTNLRSSDPFTDVHLVPGTLGVNSFNVFAGYYNMHSPNEYVVVKDTEKGRDLGLAIIEKMGNKKYEIDTNYKNQKLLYEQITKKTLD